MTNQTDQVYDLFIVGGGINGVGIARDAVGRDFSVFLAEQNDFASGTSSGSTKLIHGGLRYLEHYEFNLVRKALAEREVLWKIAPHIVYPLRFILPHFKGIRPAWFLRLGLFLYDHLGGRKLLPATKNINLKTHKTGKPLKPMFTKGFEYSDCWVDDARLVVLNAVDAERLGATVTTRTKVIKTEKTGDLWNVTIQDLKTGNTQIVQSKMLINATGPWVDRFLNESDETNNVHNVRLVQGSHVVVNKIYDHDRAYIFQNNDGRIIFAIPYEDDFTMLGTTDHDFEGDPGDAEITDTEAEYICKCASEYFKQKITTGQVVWKFSAVRPLFDDGASKAQEATRDYVLRIEKDGNGPALLNIFGGKITTYRKLSEAVLEKIESVLGAKNPTWTEAAPLPGGAFAVDEKHALAQKLSNEKTFIKAAHAKRLIKLYGTLAFDMLKDIHSPEEMGENFGHDLYAFEVHYLREKEYAQTSEDILFRRTKLGLRVSDHDRAKLDHYLQHA